MGSRACMGSTDGVECRHRGERWSHFGCQVIERSPSPSPPQAAKRVKDLQLFLYPNSPHAFMNGGCLEGAPQTVGAFTSPTTPTPSSACSPPPHAMPSGCQPGPHALNPNTCEPAKP